MSISLQVNLIVDEICHQITSLQIDQERKERKDFIDKAKRIRLHKSMNANEKRRRLQRASEQKALFLFNQRKKRLEKAYRLRREYLIKEICKTYLLFFWVEIRLPYQGLTFVIHCPGLFYSE